MKKLSPREKIEKGLSKINRRSGVLKRKRARLERVKEAFNDYRGGRITKTELRRRVPRSWMEYA